jgi:hypothetical protein
VNALNGLLQDAIDERVKGEADMAALRDAAARADQNGFMAAADGVSQIIARLAAEFVMSEQLPGGRHPDYEIDHLIPLGIGGADSDANLWPEPRATVEPEWNAERKDQLEAKLRALVCAGRLDIVVAQKAVADDWTVAWRCYVDLFPLPGEMPFAWW